MNERKVHPHAIRDSCGAFCASSIGADDDGILIVGDESLDISLEKWSSVKIVHRDIEESLHWIIHTSILFSGFRKKGGKRLRHPQLAPSPCRWHVTATNNRRVTPTLRVVQVHGDHYSQELASLSGGQLPEYTAYRDQHQRMSKDSPQAFQPAQPTAYNRVSLRKR